VSLSAPAKYDIDEVEDVYSELILKQSRNFSLDGSKESPSLPTWYDESRPYANSTVSPGHS
jgi:hypothetical protein